MNVLNLGLILMSDAQRILTFDVEMTCGGCSAAVTRILSKLDGVAELTTDVPTRRVVVKGTVGADQVLEKLKPWLTASGKHASLVSEA